MGISTESSRNELDGCLPDDRRLSPVSSKGSCSSNKENEDMTFTKGTRNAMGEYVPLNGGKPLTQLALPLPGAADYSPDISKIKPTAPQFSIVGKPKEKRSNEIPGPDQYHPEDDMVWKRKTWPMGEKGKPNDDTTCSLGPAAYMTNHNNIGLDGAPKWSISNRTKVMQGPPNSRVQPVDVHGFETPAPNQYRVNLGHWDKSIKKSIGLPLKCRDISGPGPAEYKSPLEDRGPAYSMSKRLLPSKTDNYPGPAAYDLGTTIGKTVAKSISSRLPEMDNSWTPSPNTYGIASQFQDGPKHSMTYRRFERKMSPRPTPASYKPNPSNLLKHPEYSCRMECQPGFPDILNYPQHSLMKNSKVGPASYNLHNSGSNNDGPAYSMGKRLDPIFNDTPGPAAYDLQRNTKKVAAVSMGVRSKSKESSVGPGPAAYYPKVKSSGPEYSMTSRSKKETTSTNPAPNSYRIKSGQNNRGISNGTKVTLKGRPSPFVYSGFNQILTN